MPTPSGWPSCHFRVSKPSTISWGQVIPAVTGRSRIRGKHGHLCSRKIHYGVHNGAEREKSMNKIWPDAGAALKDIVKNDMVLAIGGFGLCGIPETLITALRDTGVRGLTIASNNAGIDGYGIGVLLETHQIRIMISSYVGGERRVRTLMPARGNRGRVRSPGNSRRTHASRWRWHSRLLHAHRCRNHGS